eukprot:5995727-Pyramimonas_sp.AAC.1
MPHSAKNGTSGAHTSMWAICFHDLLISQLTLIGRLKAFDFDIVQTYTSVESARAWASRWASA